MGNMRIIWIDDLNTTDGFGFRKRKLEWHRCVTLEITSAFGTQNDRK